MRNYNICKKCGKQIWKLYDCDMSKLCKCKYPKDIDLEMIKRCICDSSLETLGYGELTNSLAKVIKNLFKKRKLK